MISYRELQIALKRYKKQGITSVKLNATKVLLQAEYNRIISEIESKKNQVMGEFAKLAKLVKVPTELVVEMCKNQDYFESDLVVIAEKTRSTFEKVKEKIGDFYQIFKRAWNNFVNKDNDNTMLDFIAQKLYLETDQVLALLK